MIQKIIQDETWLEGERRGCYVASDDPVVREKVCAIILRVGQQLREAVLRDAAAAVECELAAGSRAEDRQAAA